MTRAARGGAERCIHCDRAFGADKVVADISGSAVAFDASTSSVWSICRSCTRWSLAPLEPGERAAVLEELESRYAAAPHADRDGLGVAQVGKGELIRVGGASFAQFASWRYRQGLRRASRRYWSLVALGGVGMVFFYTPWADWLFGTDWGGIAVLLLIAATLTIGTRATVLRSRQGRVSVGQAGRAQVDVTGSGWRVIAESSRGVVDFSGDEGLRALGKMLPWSRRGAVTEAEISAAIKMIEEGGGPRRFITEHLSTAGLGLGQTSFRDLPPRFRLALEIAANEESERRVLGDHMAGVKLSHREAAQVADIAETL